MLSTLSATGFFILELLGAIAGIGLGVYFCGSRTITSRFIGLTFCIFGIGNAVFAVLWASQLGWF